MDLHLKKVMTYFVEFVQDKEKTETPPPEWHKAEGGWVVYGKILPLEWCESNK